MASKLSKSKGLKTYRKVLDAKIKKQKITVREARQYVLDAGDRRDSDWCDVADHRHDVEEMRLNTLEEVRKELYAMEKEFKDIYHKEQLGLVNHD